MNMHRAVLGFTTIAALVSSSVGAQWLKYPTTGIPRLSNGQPDLSAPAPRTPDGRPDLTGLWTTADREVLFNLARTLDPSAVEMTPWAAAIQKQRESREHVDDPVGYCLPHGTPRILFTDGGFKILTTPSVTAFLHEAGAYSTFREVFTDGRPFPEIAEPTWFGYSIGRWDADTFVVESTGFRDRGWLDTEKGRPHSDALLVIQQFRRVDFGHMDVTITIDDAKAYLKPWTIRAAFVLRPDTELLESSCEAHDKTMEHRRIAPPPPEPPSPPLPERR